jgi:multidrug efflux pump subunit AcrA (membrane-fusion protein)
VSNVALIDDFLQTLAGLTSSERDMSMFHRRLVELIQSRLPCRSAAVWTRGTDGRFLLSQSAPPQTGEVRTVAETAAAWGQFCAELMGHDEVRLLPMGLEMSVSPELVCAGRRIGSTLRSPAVLLVECERGSAGLMADALGTAGIIIDNAERQRHVEVLERTVENLREVCRLGGELQPAKTAGELGCILVNSVRRILRCDRVTLVSYLGALAEVLQISGVDQLNRRSAVVQDLQLMAEAFRESAAWEWISAAPESSLSPERRMAFRHYQENQGFGGIGFFPLERGVASGLRFGLLVEWKQVESFPDPAEQLELLEWTLGGTGVRLRGIYKNDGLLGGWMGSSVGPPLRKRGLYALALIVAVLILLIPVPFRIEARGELLPKLVRNIFAAESGMVTEISVTSESSVRVGQRLLRIESPQLQQEFERVSGNLLTAEERLRSLRAARLSRPVDSTVRMMSDMLAEAELEAEVSGLEQQSAILRRRIESLEVVSPIDGLILTWDAVRRLENRPVQPGQVLLTVADPASGWEAHLRIPAGQLDHVVEATAGVSQALEVGFHTEDGRPLGDSASLSSVSRTAVRGPDGETIVRAIARFERLPEAACRPGTSVRAQLHCGHRTLGYVWFHEFFSFLRMKLLW